MMVKLASFTRARPSPAPCSCAAADTLYGRYWGASDDFHSLHFETCYYQGIDYCIREGLPASSRAPRASTRSLAASCRR